MTITGRTRILPLIGHPVAQVSTPPIINAWAESAGHDLVMIPLELPSDAIPAFSDNLRLWGNCVGCSVTVPYKQAAFASMDDVTERAAAVGSVNIVRRDPDGRLCGDMTDGAALVAELAPVSTGHLGIAMEAQAYA